MKKNLRHGYSTGSCAAAATKGATLMLLKQALISKVSIDLPAGISATFQLHGQSFSANEASCFVIKDAGDDPDITNGVKVWAKATIPERREKGQEWPATIIEGGIGIGRVTKPGLAIPPGEWAINPVPRRMIEEAILSAFSPFPIHSSTFSLKISISIPDGEKRAKKTLNARLGIIGGLSILGTTGIVRPISTKAWTDTIDSALNVAKACGCQTVVLSTGRSSEIAVQQMFNVKDSLSNVSERELQTINLKKFPEEAYIMMGDHIAYTLKACKKRGFNSPIIACQFAKMIKIACGHENTHAAASTLDLAALQKWAESVPLYPGIIAIIANANTAREIAIASGFDKSLIKMVAERVKIAATLHVPDIDVRPILCGYNNLVIL